MEIMRGGDSDNASAGTVPEEPHFSAKSEFYK
jgi:hypothetical protein